MRTIVLVLILLGSFVMNGKTQDILPSEQYQKHGVVWSAGFFKSWLKDNYVGFDKIGDSVTPTFSQQYKMGFSATSHYMYKPLSWMGVGVHLGLGLDVNSYIEAPVLLFGASISLGNDHQFIIDFGWSDGKRRIIPGIIRDQITNSTYTEIPETYDHTELNTGFYIGLGYRIF